MTLLDTGDCVGPYTFQKNKRISHAPETGGVSTPFFVRGPTNKMAMHFDDSALISSSLTPQICE